MTYSPFRASTSWWIDDLHIGSKVDVNSSGFCIATIKNITRKTNYGCKLHLHFDGYSAKNDRSLKIKYTEDSSQIIKPFNSLTYYHNYIKYSQLKPCNQKIGYVYFKAAYKSCISCSKKCCLTCKSISSHRLCEDCCSVKEYKRIHNALQCTLDSMDGSIINIITSYSIGIIIKCSNYINCHNEIIFDNEFQVHVDMDYQMKNVYQYSYDHIRKCRDDIKYYNIYGKYRRIFCRQCQNVKTIKTCQLLHCNIKDLFVDEITNGYKKYTMCDNHKFCALCKFPPKSLDDYNQCIKCGQYFCEKCFGQQTCVKCIESNKVYKCINYLNSLIHEKIDSIKISLCYQTKREHEIKQEYNDKIINSFQEATKQVSSLCFVLNHPTIISVQYSLLHAYKNVLAFGLGLGDLAPYKLNIIKKASNHTIKNVLNTDSDSKMSDIWAQIEQFREIQKTKERLMNEISSIKENIIDYSYNISSVIGSYSVGFTLNCSNPQCNKVINFNNTSEILGKNDYKRSKISYYTVTEDKLRDELEYHTIDHEYMRIFCGDCKNVIKKCEHRKCDVKDLYISSSKPNDQHKSFYTCGDHTSCKSCCVEPKSDAYLSQCDKCKEYCCNQCYFDNNCRVCTEYTNINDQRQIINHVIGDILDMDSINIIATFSIGFLIKCCNYIKKCKKDIYIRNKFDLNHKRDDNGNKIYLYEAKKYAKQNAINMYDTFYIVFCSECTKNELSTCNFWWRYAQCKNKDAHHVCQNHRKCDLCHIRKTYISQQCIMKNCFNRFCHSCRFKEMCIPCSISQEFMFRKCSIQNGLKNTLSIVIYANIIHIITEYCMGYTAKCGNYRKCHSEITISNEFEMIKHRQDINGNNIYQYPATYNYNRHKHQFGSQLNTINMYTRPRRIFCSNCALTELHVCPHCGIKDIDLQTQDCVHCEGHFQQYYHNMDMSDDYESDDYAVNCSDHFDYGNDMGKEKYIRQELFNKHYWSKLRVSSRKKEPKTQNKKKKRAYFKKKSDRIQNKLSKKRFNKKYALQLQY